VVGSENCFSSFWTFLKQYFVKALLHVHIFINNSFALFIM
jgi:hypothetical protein